MSSFPDPAASTSSSDPRLGTILAGKWRLDGVLGKGGMATVYAATHRNRSKVAIKILHASHGSEMVQRFLMEGYLGNIVDHPGVVRTLDDGVTDDEVPFLVMELLEGETLHERLDRMERLSVEEAVRVICAVLDILSAAHAARLVHRDVKPENIFLLRSGGVKLLDFGIARERRSGGEETVAGFVLGSPGYMAVEQALGRQDEIDARTDIWAVGATLFVALTGRSLRAGETLEEKLCQAMLPVDPVRMLAPEIPPAIAMVLDRALAYERHARFASASEMQAALAATVPRAAEPPTRPAVVPERSAPGPVYPAAGRASSLSPMAASQGTLPSPVERGKGALLALGSLAVVLAILLPVILRGESSPRASFLPPVPALPAESAHVEVPPPMPVGLELRESSPADVVTPSARMSAAPPAASAPSLASDSSLSIPRSPSAPGSGSARLGSRPSPSASRPTEPGKPKLDPMAAGRF